MNDSNEKDETVYVLDSYGLIFRCYFAFINNPLINGDGKNISGLFGFFRNLHYVFEHYKPRHLVCAMDSKTKTFRHEFYPEYKATRNKTPDDLHAQIPWIIDILDALEVPVLQADGYEADDIIATVAKHCENRAVPCRILSGDKDLMQLVSDEKNIQILKPEKNATWKVVSEAGVQAEWGVSPEQLLDLLSLYGDAVDNIPGVRGVGTVTAAKLLAEYKNLQGIYEHIDEIKGALKQKLIDGKENAFFSEKLVRLCDEVPCENLDDVLFGDAKPLNYEKAAEKLKEYGAFSVAKQWTVDSGQWSSQLTVDSGQWTDSSSQVSMDSYGDSRLAMTGGQAISNDGFRNSPFDSVAMTSGQAISNAQRPPVNVSLTQNHGEYACVTELGCLVRFVDDVLASSEKIVAFDCETDRLDAINAKIVGFSLSREKGKAIYVPLMTNNLFSAVDFIKKDDAFVQLARLFNDENVTMVFHNGKFDLKVLYGQGLGLRFKVLGESSQRKQSTVDSGQWTDSSSQVSMDSYGDSRLAMTGGQAISNDEFSHSPFGSVAMTGGHTISNDGFLHSLHSVEMTRCKVVDTMVAAWLLWPERMGKMSYSLESLAENYLHLKGIEYDEVVSKGQTFADVEIEKAVPYAAEDADFTLQLWMVLKELLEKNGFMKLFLETEMRLMPILCEMELTGIHIDAEILNNYNKELTCGIEEKENEIYNTVGHKFNIASPKQLQTILFDERGLKASKKTKTGYSTDTSVLEELSMVDAVPRLILEYREMAKLQSTYVETLPTMADKSGRIHTDFVQTGTATGRLSCREPNLQNIPVRSEAGRKIRSAFTAPDGKVLISADYSQIELVVLAHLSGDENMCRSFIDKTDIHKATAALIFGVSSDEVTNEMRRTAKTINFGVIYGMSAFRLSNELGISRTQAKEFIDNYFMTYSSVSRFIEETVKKAEETGFSETLFGHRRPILNINSKNKVEKAAAERIAVNTPVQGSAADIVKKAMIDVDEALSNASEVLGAKLLLQVHDELILECPDDEKIVAETVALVKDKMENAVKLRVPLRVSIESGKNWGEFH